MAKYRVTKTWDHNLGLSVAFRQWPAVETHCKYIHGYPLAITATFESETLDHRNWVISFGELKPVKAFLEDLLDHKTLVAVDDPHLSWFLRAEELGIMQVKIVPKVGCEAVAETVAFEIYRLMGEKMKKNNVQLVSVEVREHSGNSATYMCDKQETCNALPDDPYEVEIPTQAFDGALTASSSASTAKMAGSGQLSYIPSNTITITGPSGSITLGALPDGGNKTRDIPKMTIGRADFEINQDTGERVSIDPSRLRLAHGNAAVTGDFRIGNTLVNGGTTLAN